MASRYGSLALDDLRAELKKRGAKLSGRKKELVERLESYDRNSNFGRDKFEPQTKDYNMTLPSVSGYVDIHSEKSLAPVDEEKVSLYLSHFDKVLDNKAIQLYKEKYLCHLRISSTKMFDFVKSLCRAEMKKSVRYSVDVSLTKDGHIEETQCECAAGMGPHAHCKHVCAVLYACVMFHRTKTVLVEETCTQKLQTFHQAKRYFGSPIKSWDINMAGADELTCTNSKFDPRPEEFRRMPWYPSYFQSICLNFKGISAMPIFQIFEPANNFAVAHDHDYLVETPEDTFLRHIGVSHINEKERQKLEQMTRGQSQNKLWQEERTKRIQSSNFGRVCKATQRTNFHSLADSLMCSKSIKTKAITHGLKFEREAIKEYERIAKCVVRDCGIFVSMTHSYLGASPDGIVNDNLLCEVKCPFTAKNRQINKVSVPYLKFENGDVSLDRNHDYHYQVQGQLFCTGRQYCDFIVYTLVDIKIIRIQRDDSFITEMLQNLEGFYKNFFEPALLEKHFYKSY